MMKKVGILLALFMLVFSTLGQSISFANTGEISVPNENEVEQLPVKYVETTETAKAYSEQHGELGEIGVGSFLVVRDETEEKVYFQWGEQLAYVKKEKTQEAVLTEDTLLVKAENVEETQIQEYFKSSEVVEVELLDPTNSVNEEKNSYFTINPDILYPILEKKDGFLKIAIGDFYYYIEENQFTLKYSQVDETGDTPSEETSTETPKEESESNDEGVVDTSEPTEETSEEESIDQNEGVEEEPTNSDSNHQEGVVAEEQENNQDEVMAEEPNKSEEDQANEIKASAAAFTSSVRYFEVVGATAIYIKQNGKLVRSGRLSEGQTYPRIRDYGPNWHEIPFANGVAYVMKDYTKPSDASKIKNLNHSYKNSSKTFRPLLNVAVYDNSSGTLVPFSGIYTNMDYPIVGDYGNWYRVVVAGRVGYVKKSDVRSSFTPSDKYFKVLETTAIYINENGNLVRVGRVPAGEVYPRIGDYGPNWHQVKFGNTVGYVSKDYTTPVGGSSIHNVNTNYTNSSRNFIPKENVAVYDNSSGKLVPFAGINMGVKYPIVGDYGNWYRVIYSDRVGYVRKADVNVEFKTTDKYFQATDDVAIYINENGNLISVGSVLKGQVYPRIRDYGDNWHEVKFGNTVGYVAKDNTVPYNGSLNDINSSSNSAKSFYLNQNVAVYAKNNAGDLVHVSTLYSNYRYPVVSDYGSWYMVDILGRTGYVRKSDVQTGQVVTTESLPVYNSWSELSDWTVHLSSNYSHQAVLSYGDLVNILETYSYGSKVMFKNNEVGWVQNSYLLDNPMDNTWMLLEDRNIRTDRLVDSSTLIGLVPAGTKVKLLDYQYDGKDSYKHWYKIQTLDGRVGWLTGYSSSRGKLLIRIEDATNTFSVFTDLRSQQRNVTARAIDEYVRSKKPESVMIGMGQTYLNAAEQSGVNVVYLLVHSILETSWGTSTLVKEKNNFFGISAYDSCVYTCATAWDTKESGLIDGSKWIANNYIYGGNKQYTLDHMRNNHGVHQYATDEAWHQKIANLARDFIEFNNNYNK